MGVLLSVFQLVYAIGQIPAGVLVDRYGARRVLGGGLLFWSLAQGAAGFAGSLAQLLVTRGLLGLGESTAGPSAQRVTTAWFAVDRRGRTTGIWNSVSTLGSALAPPLLTILMLAYGWRFMFVTMGVIGVLLTLVWFACYRDRSAYDASLVASGLLHAVDLAPPPPSWRRWGGLLASRSTWGCMVGYFGVVYMAWVWHAWLPGYLEIQRHMSIARTGWVAAVPFVFGVVGSIGCGRLSDALVAHGMAATWARRLPLVVAMVGTALCTLLAAVVEGDVAAVACVSGALFFTGAASAMAWTVAALIAPRGLEGALTGLQTCGGFLGGALAPVVTGYLVRETHSFTLPLQVAAVVGGVTLCGYLMVSRQPIGTSIDPPGRVDSAESQRHSRSTAGDRRIAGNAATK